MKTRTILEQMKNQKSIIEEALANYSKEDENVSDLGVKMWREKLDLHNEYALALLERDNSRKKLVKCIKVAIELSCYEMSKREKRLLKKGVLVEEVAKDVLYFFEDLIDAHDRWMSRYFEYKDLDS